MESLRSPCGSPGPTMDMDTFSLLAGSFDTEMCIFTLRSNLYVEGEGGFSISSLRDVLAMIQTMFFKSEH